MRSLVNFAVWCRLGAYLAQTGKGADWKGCRLGADWMVQTGKGADLVQTGKGADLVQTGKGADWMVQTGKGADWMVQTRKMVQTGWCRQMSGGCRLEKWCRQINGCLNVTKITCAFFRCAF